MMNLSAANQTWTENNNNGVSPAGSFFDLKHQLVPRAPQFANAYAITNKEKVSLGGKFILNYYRTLHSMNWDGHRPAGDYRIKTQLFMYSEHDEVSRTNSVFILGTKCWGDVDISVGDVPLGPVGWFFFGFQDGPPLPIDGLLKDKLKCRAGFQQFPGSLKASYSVALQRALTLINPSTGKPYGTLPSLIDEILAQYETWKEGEDMIIFGHSMGGAVAQIVAYIVAMGPKQFKSIKVIIAGSVTVLDRTAVDTMQKAGVECINLAFENDAVPQFWEENFTDLGPMIMIELSSLAILPHGMWRYLEAVSANEAKVKFYYKAHK
ncbi:hypothetical protein KCU95_g5226, partial [Aureobasidium melanogenum]